MNLEKAFKGVDLFVKIATSSAKDFMGLGYMTIKVEFEKNAYTLYMWLVPAKPYAPLD